MSGSRPRDRDERSNGSAFCPHREGCRGELRKVIVELETYLCARHYVELAQAPGAELTWPSLSEEDHERLAEERELRDHLSDAPFWEKPTRR